MEYLRLLLLLWTGVLAVFVVVMLDICLRKEERS